MIKRKKIKLLVHTPMVPYTITLASKPTGCVHKKDLHHLTLGSKASAADYNRVLSYTKSAFVEQETVLRATGRSLMPYGNPISLNESSMVRHTAHG